jgi:endonuclease YncB( thermonuclease family)
VPVVERMRIRGFPVPIWSMVLAWLMAATPGWAANAIVRDGNTLQLGDITYRLDGIDAPDLDQVCIDDHADPWTCGVDARDQLAKLIGQRPVQCSDQGPDRNHRRRHRGVCTVEGETISLNQLLVQQGLAVSLEPATSSPLRDDEAGAKSDGRGLWKGCFVSPEEFRHGNKDGVLLGRSCRADKDREIRDVLFPNDPAMPPGCGIKGRYAVRARVTGNIGIYHLRGCPSYPALTRPDRWFCTEDDAQAAGFRRAYNCRAGAPRSPEHDRQNPG